jgi:DNA-binding MarR family transcriptional regulator
MKEQTIKNAGQVVSFCVLLIVSSVLGFVGMPTEMALSILAGALGLAFGNLDRIARFKGAGFEAEMLVRTLEKTIATQTEPTPERQQEAARSGISLTPLEVEVLTSLMRPNYTWRYARSVAKEIGQSEASTVEVLAKMRDRGLTEKGKGSNGEIWTATAEGRSAHPQPEAVKA